MQAYLDLVKDVLENGRFKGDRTGTGTLSVFGRQLRFDLSKGFPLVTTKKVHLKSIIHELLWFLRGETNIRYLKDNGVSIWDAWSIPLERPMSFVELTNSLAKVTGVDPRNLIKVFATDEHGQVIEPPQEIDPEQVAIGSTAYNEVLELIKIAEGFHGPIPTTVKSTDPMTGELGPVYGKLWRSWPDPISNTVLETMLETNSSGADLVEDLNLLLEIHKDKQIDQILEQIRALKENPDSRRHIVSAWNPTLLPVEGVSHEENVRNGRQALPPCHTLFQFYVEQLTPAERIDWIRANKPLEAEATDTFLLEEVKAGKFMHEDEDAGTEALIARNYELYAAIPAPEKRLSCQLYQR